MQRRSFAERDNWVERCAGDGFQFPTLNGKQYWRETAGYEFSVDEVDRIEAATLELHSMCLDLVEDIVKSGDYAQYRLPETALPLIERSWQAKELYVYGRFDLIFDGANIKMLEYNADTPTSLLEASVVQWTWKTDHKLPDQFNSIHEKLVERWKLLASTLKPGQRIYFATGSESGLEDWSNVEYLTETAVQAGIECSLIPLSEIGWNTQEQAFVDMKGEPIGTCFKLYPWEWVMSDQFGTHIYHSGTKFIEPAWKMLLSNKAILPLLWKKHSGHPLLLPAYFEGDDSMDLSKGEWIRKPMLSREGANVSLVQNGEIKPLAGSTHHEGYDRNYVLQERCQLPQFDGWYPIIGSWVIGDESAGMGIREDPNPVTGNESYFVPHFFKEA